MNTYKADKNNFLKSITTFAYRYGIFFFILLFGLILISACSSKENKKKEVRPVMAIQVDNNPINAVYSYAGVVKSRYEIPLSFQVAGKINSRLVADGDKVKPGQLLATLEQEDLKIQVHAKEQAVGAAKSNLELAKAELNRYGQLVSKGYVSASQIQQLQAKFASASAELSQANSDLEYSKRQLAYSNLYSDKNGLIIDVLASPGEVVSAGKPVLKMATTNEIEIQIYVPEQRIEQWQSKKGIVDVVLWANPEKHYKARINEINLDSDPATRTFIVKLAIDNPDSAMQLGMTANVKLSLLSDDKQLKVPMEAIFYAGKQAFVWIVDPKKMRVKKIPVKLGAYTLNDNIFITSGLKQGQLVVTAGVHQLTDGQTVSILDPKTMADNPS